MTIFRGFLHVLARNFWPVLIFTIIMLAMGFPVLKAGATTAGTFSPEKQSIAIINDGLETPLTKAFENYMGKHAVFPDVGTSDREIDDALYYDQLSYAVYLPPDFTETVLEGKEPTVDVKSRASANSAAVEKLVSRFGRLACGYAQYIQDEDKLIEAIDSSSELSSEVVITSKLDQQTLQKVSYFYNFSSYTLLAGVAYVVTMVLASFSKINVRKRTIVSPARPAKIDFSLMLGCGIIALLLAGLNVGLVHVLKPSVVETGRAGLYALNTFAYAWPVLAISLLMAKITNNKEALSAMVNVIALASAFLCGAFLPQSYLPDAVRGVAHVLPTFYFVENNDSLATMTSFTGADATQFWTNIAVQVCFALVLWAASLVIGRFRQRI